MLNSFNRFIQKNKSISLLFSVLALAVCGVLIVRSVAPPPPTQIRHAWFYDLETGKLFVGSIDSIPPIPSPTGHKGPNGDDLGVRAIVFSCGACDDESKRYVAYLETVSPDAKDAILAQVEREKKQADAGQMPDPPRYDPNLYGRFITVPEQKNWFPKDSKEASALLPGGAQNKCGDGKIPHECLPDLQ